MYVFEILSCQLLVHARGASGEGPLFSIWASLLLLVCTSWGCACCSLRAPLPSWCAPHGETRRGYEEGAKADNCGAGCAPAVVAVACVCFRWW